MVDYTRSTGGDGTMMIRDTGSIVEFWIRATNPETHFDWADWSWQTPNGSGSSRFAYGRGAGWVKVGAINVTVDGNVSWWLGDTGTWGLGGPTNQVVWISRGTIPQAPRIVGISNVMHTSMVLTFQSQGTGGLPLREWQISAGTNGSSPDSNLKFGGTGVVTFGLLSVDTDYYFWVRGRNDKGWGPWSARASAKTLPPIYVKVSGIWRAAIPFVKVDGRWRDSIGYVKNNGIWRKAAK